MNIRVKKNLSNHAWMITLLTVVILAFSLTQPGIVQAQTDAWVYNPGNGHYYRLTEPLTWFDAEAQAQAWGGHLVTLDNADEESWIKDTFGRYDHFWIGFSDIEEEGIWIWSSDVPVTYTNWAEGEPNNCCFCTDYPGCEDAAVMNWQAETGSGTYGDYWNDLAPDGQFRGVVERSLIYVSINIKPGSDSNSINLESKGVVPVAVLTTDEFDASNLDPVTILFAGASPLRWIQEDVDWDGDMDLLFHFKTQELNLDTNSTEAVFTGQTFGGVSVQGLDSVKIVPGE